VEAKILKCLGMNEKYPVTKSHQPVEVRVTKSGKVVRWEGGKVVKW
jgi:hypothetical protein